MEGPPHAANFPNAGEQEVIESLYTLAPPFEVPGAFRTSYRHITHKCALFGCNLCMSVEFSPYCSIAHRNIADANVNRLQAFHFFDGFIPSTRANQHCDQHAQCASALIYASNGVNVGIPTFCTTTFINPPWVQSERYSTRLKADWLFLCNTFNRMLEMNQNSDGVQLAWRISSSKKSVLVSCLPADYQINVVQYTLQVASDKNTDAARRMMLLAQGWKFFRYRMETREKLSLFCLTKVQDDFTEPTIKTNQSKHQNEEVVEGADEPDTHADAKGNMTDGASKEKRARKGDAGSGSAPVGTGVVSHTYKNADKALIAAEEYTGVDVTLGFAAESLKMNSMGKGEEATAISAFKRGLDAPNTHLTSNTYLVGHSFTVVGYPHAVCDFNLGFYTPLINQPNFKKVVVGDGLKLTELMPSDAVGSLKLMEKAKVAPCVEHGRVNAITEHE